MRPASIFCCLLLAASHPLAAQDKLPEGPGKAVLLKTCKTCHPPDTAASKRHTHDEWEEVIQKMIDTGATGTDEEFDQIVDYLARAFPKLDKVNVNQAPAEDLAATLALPFPSAQAIVNWRAKNGPYRTADDLKKVPGVDAAKLDAARDKILY
ncbi:MAG: helix-hairpin-helix domain-containing protein [Acidobacteriota bacterium]|nr:helix-hairpin-helix domain-containing protein [Acidobacteriota bacterium]